MTVVRRRPAMAAWFECRLVGAEPGVLGPVAERMLDEVERLGRLLSRHDPAGEVARVNRDAARRPVRLDPEVFAVLADALGRREATDGYFDVVAPRGGAAELVRLDPDARTIRFLEAGPMIDLGGYGKGCALDASARLLDEFGVASALLHGGTSSILARGRPEGAAAWVVGLVDPADGATEVGRVSLADGEALSTSGAFDPGSDASDLVDPATGRPLAEPASCTVVAATATDAEVLSTALLVMGKARAVGYLRSCSPAPRRVAWVDRGGLDWLEIGGSP